MSDEALPTLSEGVSPPLTVGEAGLGHAPLDREGFSQLAEKLLEHLSAAPHDMGLLLDLSVALQLASRRDDGLIAQREALLRQRVYRICGAAGPPTAPQLRMLAFAAPGDLMTNTPLEFIVEHIPVRLDMLFVIPGEPLPEEIPDHDVAFVAVSQSDEREGTLRRLARLSRSWPRPTLQDPMRLVETSREAIYHALRDIPGLLVPPVARVERKTLEALAEARARLSDIGDGFRLPLLVRPIDSHAGRNLAKIEDLADLSGYLAETDEREYYLTQFVEHAGPDGQHRKYRIVLIEGRPYLCHLAITDHWMVHFAHAGMSESEAKRSEEAHAMEHFDEEFALRHARVFRAIQERVGLDYLGIDCGETPGGELLLFEADASMVIHAMDPPSLFPYKQVQMRKVFDAFYAMLERASKGINWRTVPSA